MNKIEYVGCKYQSQNAEKFNGKSYCTCLNRLCEDIAFVCDKNCQIYEDYKQLQAKEQECEELKGENFTFEDLIKIQEKLIEKYKQALNSIEKYQQRNCETCMFANTQKCDISCQVFVILDTIHKAKEQ